MWNWGGDITLASETMNKVSCLMRESLYILSSLFQWVTKASESFQFTGIKEKWSEKMFINLKPEEI